MPYLGAIWVGRWYNFSKERIMKKKIFLGCLLLISLASLSACTSMGRPHCMATKVGNHR